MLLMNVFDASEMESVFQWAKDANEMISRMKYMQQQHDC
jgi:hypothetical protein